MILVEPIQFNSPEDYIASLSKKARKNYHAVMKANPTTVYEEILFEEELVQDFMSLWEQQLIRGEKRQWAFGVDHVRDLDNKGLLHVFVATDSDGSIVSAHFVEEHDGYIEAHPPMYDKERHKGRSLAKFMWFNLMMWGVDNKIRFIDMGGGSEPDWREMIRNRDKYPNPAYKWIYVPKAVKDNPNNQPRYAVESDTERKWVREID